MEKRIVALSTNPHTVSLTDRKCSLFLDPKSGSIFIDEGDGEGRMNGIVFSGENSPRFAVLALSGPDHQLVLDYGGVQYTIGVSDKGDDLRQWADSANVLLSEKGEQAAPLPRTRYEFPPGYTAHQVGAEPAAGSPVVSALAWAECPSDVEDRMPNLPPPTVSPVPRASLHPTL